MTPLRLGILGASRIAPKAIVAAATEVPGVEVAAIAARDGRRAAAFAEAFGIEQAFEGYGTLLEAARVDAVYVALPASEHARWSIAAVERGLHVLVEKPFTLNADEAQHVVAAGDEAGLVVAEAFHWRYHPLATMMIDLARELGTIRSASAAFEVTNDDPTDIRWQLELGGGALMDIGCYTVHWLRTALGAEPEVVSAEAQLVAPELDGAIEASLAFPDVREATIRASMLSRWPSDEFVARVELAGERGYVRIDNPLLPQERHAIEFELDGKWKSVSVSRRTTYSFQLQAFRDAVVDGARLPTGGRDAIANMRAIDAIYSAAGLPPRGPKVPGAAANSPPARRVG
jgi:predicted dehydrogenase